MDQLYHLRRDLNRYIRILHTPGGEMQKTPWWIHGRISTLRRLCPDVRSRFHVSDPTRFTIEKFRRHREILQQLSHQGNVLQERESHPWRQYVAHDGTHSTFSTLSRDIRNTFELLRAGYQENSGTLEKLSREGLLPEQASRSDCQRVIRFLGSLRHEPVFPAEWFTADPSNVIRLLHRIRELRQEESRQITSLRNFFTDHFLNQTQRTEKISLFLETDNNPIVNRSQWKKLDTLPQRLHFLGEKIREVRTMMDLCTSTIATQKQLLRTMALPTDLVHRFRLRIPTIVQLAGIIAKIPAMPGFWLQKNGAEQGELRRQLESLEALGHDLENRWNQSDIRQFFEGMCSCVAADEADDRTPGWTTSTETPGSGVRLEENRTLKSWTDIPPAMIRQLETLLTQQKKTVEQLEQVREELSTKLNFIPDLWSASSIARLNELSQQIPDLEEKIRALGQIRSQISGDRRIPVDWKTLTLGQMREIRITLEQLESSLRPLEQMRARLSERMTDEAFRETGRQLAAEVRRYHSVWQRMPWSIWGQFRRTVIRKLYRSDRSAPGGRMIRNDLRELEKYHKHRAATIRTVSEYLDLDSGSLITLKEISDRLSIRKEFLTTYEQLCRKSSEVTGISPARSGDLTGVVVRES
ncbi:MAG: hypothetical protein Q4C47_00950 [Planctomycetia bacterium]|nr:hypothetical protein [Planctomycetia bacterium]